VAQPEVRVQQTVPGAVASPPLPSDLHGPIPQPGTRPRVRRAAGSTFSVLAVLALLVLILYPLLCILLQSVLPDLFSVPTNLTFSLAPFQRAFSSNEIFGAMGNTVWLGALVALAGTLLGTVLAITIKRTDVPGARLFNGLVWINLFTPTYLVALAWELTFSRGGIIDSSLVPLPDGLINTIFSPVGLTVLLALRMFPFSYLAVSAALAGLGSEYEEAARMVGARSRRCWLRINVPLLAPALFAGALLIFAETISDYGTAATIAQQAGFNLITYELYAGLNNEPVDFALSAALALLLIAAIAAAVLLQARLMRARSYQVITGRTRRARVLSLARVRRPMAALVALLFFFALGMPLVVTIAVSFMHNVVNGMARSNLTLANYQQALDRNGAVLPALQRSTVLALAAATITALLGPAIAYVIERTRLPGRSFLRVLTLTTIAIPGIVLAAGYIFAWNQPWMNNLPGGTPYPSLGLLLAVYVAGSLPFSIRLAGGSLAQIGDHLLEAARLAGARPGRIYRSVVLPLVLTAVLSTWMLVFTGTMFELPASELLQPPGQPPVAVEIVNLFNNYQDGAGTAMTIMGLAVVTVLALLLGGAGTLLRMRMGGRRGS
jgi:iron(III) transport system permease protein